MASTLGHIARGIITSIGPNTKSNLKYFEIRTSSLRIFENFEGSFVNTSKRQNPRWLFSWFIQCL